MKTKLYNTKGKEVGDIELNDSVFGSDVNKKVLSEYVYIYQSNQREGNAKVKDRSEVRGGGKKPHKQKGTGRARAGSNRSPLWRGGGITFGPTNEVNHKKKMTKKFRAVAFRSAFSLLNSESKVRILDSLDLEASTKKGIDFLTAFGNPRKVIVITANKNENAIKSLSNLKNAEVKTVTKLDVFSMLKFQNLIIEKDALEFINKWSK